jgi:ankyrin repeat protein
MKIKRRMSVKFLKTGLQLALRDGNVEAAINLLRFVKINSPLSDGYPAIFHAISRGDLDMIKALIFRGGKLNLAIIVYRRMRKDDRKNYIDTPIARAITRCWFEAFVLLINKGAKINRRPHTFQSIHLAAAAYDSRILASILKLGGNPNAVDVYEDRPLDYAGSIENVKLLLDRGAVHSVRYLAHPGRHPAAT